MEFLSSKGVVWHTEDFRLERPDVYRVYVGPPLDMWQQPNQADYVEVPVNWDDELRQQVELFAANHPHYMKGARTSTATPADKVRLLEA